MITQAADQSGEPEANTRRDQERRRCQDLRGPHLEHEAHQLLHHLRRVEDALHPAQPRSMHGYMKIFRGVFLSSMVRPIKVNY